MKDRRITKTRKSIQNAYLNLLRQKGTEKITISDIAREADIDRKTFYLHYDSTEDIIREYAEEKTRDAGWSPEIPAWDFSGTKCRM